MNDDIGTAVTKVLFLNEVSGNANAAYRFSYAGSKSGYSFGCTQMDVSNNPIAVKCLVECGFGHDDILRLKSLDKDIADLNARLLAHKDIVEHYDAIQVQGCIDHVQRVSGAANIRYADLEGIVAACDYQNQFNISDNGPYIKHFKGNQAVTADNILAFKMTFDWCKDNKEDVDRRAANIKEVCT